VSLKISLSEEFLVLGYYAICLQISGITCNLQLKFWST